MDNVTEGRNNDRTAYLPQDMLNVMLCAKIFLNWTKLNKKIMLALAKVPK